jgi:aldose 1-epimerase
MALSCSRAMPPEQPEEPQSAGKAAGLLLRQDDDLCELFPYIGGSIGSWSVQGQQMLRPVNEKSAAASSPYGMASFPLVPYSNRIGEAKFRWQGRQITLRRNYAPELHAIHGVGHECVWQLKSRSESSALLVLRHEPDTSWPWAFEARQEFSLTNRMLTLKLAATNLESHAVPLAFGHHPYLPKGGAHLQFQADGVWLAGDDLLPTTHADIAGEFDYSRSVAIQERALDNCFTGWQGPAHVAWTDQPWALEISASSALPCAVVFIHDAVDGFCFEPVPHINNALNLPGQQPTMPVISPGGSFEAVIRFRALQR